MINFFRNYELNFEKYSEANEPAIKILGELLGAVYERNVLDAEELINMIEELVKQGNTKKLKKLIRGVVGQCLIEIKTKKYTELWASCSSSGFVFGMNGDIKRLTPVTFHHNGCVLYCSNHEGDFYRTWKNKVNNVKISQEAILNAIVSHQSVIRPPFDGLYENTYRCQPGCLLRMKPDSVELEPYIVLDKDELLKEEDDFNQEDNLEFAIAAVARLYKNKLKNNSKLNVLFSGGLDSTLLMLALKEGLADNGLVYKDSGKKDEKMFASYLADHEGFKLRVIKPKNRPVIDVSRKIGTSGLAAFNGIGYLRFGFETFGFFYSDMGDYQTVITGQNADTLFHVDHFGPDNRVSGLTRVLLILKSMKYRMVYSMPFYKGTFSGKLLSPFKCSKNRKNTIGMLVMPSLIGLDEHNYPFQVETIKKDPVLQCVVNYKVKNYYDMFSDYFLNKYNTSIDSSKIKDIDPRISNHIVRTTRWLRTIGSFQQQFHNISQTEKVHVIASYSEGPIANILLNWQLGVMDVLSIKRYSHQYIKTKLGMSYSQARKDALGRMSITLLLKHLIPFKSTLKRLLLKKRKFISTDDLRNLRDILGHEDGMLERPLLNHVDDDDLKKHLNYLYDCLELKVDPETLSKTEGTQLCRLVNLQVMLGAEDESST
jgi:hypothetical protein